MHLDSLSVGVVITNWKQLNLEQLTTPIIRQRNVKPFVRFLINLVMEGFVVLK